MAQNRPASQIAQLELEILQALVSGAGTPEEWDRLMSRLAEYAWQESDHHVVYGALRKIRCRDAKTRRDELPAQATRMGFPDVNWNDYFEFRNSSNPEIEELIGKLMANAVDPLA